MTPELEEYFDNYNSLFNHPGYRQLLEDLEGNIASLSNLRTISDDAELFYRKGQIKALDTVIGLEGTMTAAREQAEAEAQEDMYV